ncbi:4-(cytidine 5'-diphospho)-2-C-methyl-D-erythritol kinase [Crateriforma conspicua]|uniref:4-diphosphocytidyl-2-C-methyl-D-erythritol kinase n=1 Tax=Crateriforma conspicua TaxID=2527996 RepID=A0A5C5YCQ1_9PLAN|nr:4-(cytidine 5'-diphospho)-2-C-methyl-D-erythritol kinase [Crateriforma conspicua]TWT72231.1 4-diphosphocytidyl-2-C-methyl-D-erythritol kinase [Crateriforma conspicua]
MSKTNASQIRMLCPAKLNLFLELCKRRDDGYHDIDTVMVAIDLVDELQIRVRQQPGISLQVDWLPSRHELSCQLGVEPSSKAATGADDQGDPSLAPESAASLLDIPCDERNLVWRAAEAAVKHFGLDLGFEITLGKRIPAGAGMGGASSNAAMTLLAIATLVGRQGDLDSLHGLAADIGSDVPFFLRLPPVPDPAGTAPAGTRNGSENSAASISPVAWATGRGEVLQPVPIGGRLNFVIVYPAIALSTARIYQGATVPDSPISSAPLRKSLQTLAISEIGQFMENRLTEPARKIASRIDEIHESMWQSGLKGVQLTGSGSASFGIADTPKSAGSAAVTLRQQLCPGARVMTACSLPPPAQTQT